MLLLSTSHVVLLSVANGINLFTVLISAIFFFFFFFFCNCSSHSSRVCLNTHRITHCLCSRPGLCTLGGPLCLKSSGLPSVPPGTYAALRPQSGPPRRVVCLPTANPGGSRGVIHSVRLSCAPRWIIHPPGSRCPHKSQGGRSRLSHVMDRNHDFFFFFFFFSVAVHYAFTGIHACKCFWKKD